MPLPANTTVLLQGSSQPGDPLGYKPKQAMIIRMTQETFEALQDVENHSKVEFDFGNTPVRILRILSCLPVEFMRLPGSLHRRHVLPCAADQGECPEPRALYPGAHGTEAEGATQALWQCDRKV